MTAQWVTYELPGKVSLPFVQHYFHYCLGHCLFFFNCLYKFFIYLQFLWPVHPENQKCPELIVVCTYPSVNQFDLWNFQIPSGCPHYGRQDRHGSIWNSTSDFWVKRQWWSPNPNPSAGFWATKEVMWPTCMVFLAVYQHCAPASCCAKPHCCSTYMQN